MDGIVNCFNSGGEMVVQCSQTVGIVFSFGVLVVGSGQLVEKSAGCDEEKESYKMFEHAFKNFMNKF